jgi:methionyl aminopeptidase
MHDLRRRDTIETSPIAERAFVCAGESDAIDQAAMIIRKNKKELEQMRRSGLLVWEILQKLAKMVEEGVSTQDLEAAAEKMMQDAGAKPAFKGYYTQSAGSKYPYVLCTSVNEQIVHGMPSAKRKLKKGDIVSIDTGVQLNGYYGDSAITVPVGEISEPTKKLLKVTEESLEMAIDKARAGNRLFDICGTVEQHVVENGFSVVREMVGHGIGTKLHEEPQIPNYVDRRNENPRLKEGMVLAIEPMVNAGAPDMRVLSDKWTAVTKDGSFSAHFEHCVAVTENGPWVLTRP